jgi:hypothetical protein
MQLLDLSFNHLPQAVGNNSFERSGTLLEFPLAFLLDNEPLLQAVLDDIDHKESVTVGASVDKLREIHGKSLPCQAFTHVLLHRIDGERRQMKSLT